MRPMRSSLEYLDICIYSIYITLFSIFLVTVLRFEPVSDWASPLFLLLLHPVVDICRPLFLFFPLFLVLVDETLVSLLEGVGEVESEAAGRER